uniref:Putative secreted protein 94 n=1 Tax=Amblyomma triste TaxID=251400 RepID=A0A023GAK0_AMBTT
MILVYLFMLVLGLCVTEGAARFPKRLIDSTEAYNSTIKMIRANESLRLLMHSSQLKVKTPQCLISKFVRKEKDQVFRTVQTNYKKEDKKFAKLKTTLKISGQKKNSSFPHLQISSIADLSPRLGIQIQTVLHAEEKECFVLQVPSSDESRPLCVLWGYKCTFQCQRKFVEVCGAGRPVHLSECYISKKENAAELGRCT